MNPKTLLLDEPFGSLDAQTRRILQEDLLSLTEGSGRTVILVTHDMDEAVLLCDRVLVMGTNPGTIKNVVDISKRLPRPRAARIEEIRSMPAYPELVATIWSELRDTSLLGR
jgi:ABC-type nitrate/sulfonate/bicarbonate transport system ATPase subunit